MAASEAVKSSEPQSSLAFINSRCCTFLSTQSCLSAAISSAIESPAITSVINAMLCPIAVKSCASSSAVRSVMVIYPSKVVIRAVSSCIAFTSMGINAASATS